MIKTNIKPTFLPSDEVICGRDLGASDINRNVRELDGYDPEVLLADVQANGQQEAIIVHRNGDTKVYTVDGNRRTYIFHIARERGLVYGPNAPKAGEPMDKILCIVHENLTPREIVQLKLNNGNRRSLNMVEVFNSVEMAIDADFKEIDIVISHNALLRAHGAAKGFNPGPELTGPALEKATVDAFKGFLQPMYLAHEAPIVLHEAFVAKLRNGGRGFPTNGVLYDLVKIHRSELEKSPLSVTRQNPGPKFLAKWNELLQKQEIAKETGTKPAGVTMRNRGQVEASLASVESPLTKIPFLMQLGDISIEHLPALDELNGRLWAALSEEDKATVLSWLPAAVSE